MIVLITPTGGRPMQFELCMNWMKNQTYQGRVCWIVVDDCVPRTTELLTADFRENWFIIKEFPEPSWKLGDNTQGRNLRVGIDLVRAFPEEWVEAIFFIEDDDYYKPEYLETMIEKLKGFDVAGEIDTMYYHVIYKGYRRNHNADHSSLFQTVISVGMIPAFEQCLKNKFIDVSFFRSIQKANLFQGENLAIGIKGLPGRDGIGMGHKRYGFVLDRDLSKLKSLLGEDYKKYE